jgi:carboxymethylenebutenolidase
LKVITQREIDQQVYQLYDEYCHGGIDRREFFRRAAALGAAGLAMAHGLLPNYARAQTISFTDSRIKAQYVTYPSPGGNAEKCAATSCSRRGRARGPRCW